MKKEIKSIMLVGFTAMTFFGINQVQAEERLSVYLSEEQLEYYAEGLIEFQSLYPDVDLEFESYVMDDLLGSAEKTKTQLMAGNGPDLLLFNSYGADDVYKMMKAGVFSPLDEYMTEENGWQKSDYVEHVIDGGKFEGVQYIIPMNYEVKLVLSSKECLEAADFSVEACTDTCSLMTETAKLYNGDYSNRILADAAQFSTFPQLLGEQFLDYEKGTVCVEEEILKKACESYSAMYEEDTTFYTGEYGYYGYGKDIVDRNAYLCVPNGIDMFLMAATGIAAKETPVIISISSGQDKSAAVIRQYAGIRANSQNKEAAWNLLKILLGEEMQREASSHTISVPVRKSVIEEEIHRTLDEALEYGKQFLDVDKPDEAFMNKYTRYLMEPEYCILVSDLCVSEFHDTMEPFYYGEAEYEECFSDFEQFARIYLTE